MSIDDKLRQEWESHCRERQRVELGRRHKVEGGYATFRIAHFAGNRIFCTVPGCMWDFEAEEEATE